MESRASKMNIKDAILSVFEKYNGKVVFAYLFGTAKGILSRLDDIDVFLMRIERSLGL
jgi:predicted nucleotidyltransferase